MQITLFTRDRDLGHALADKTVATALSSSGDWFEIGPLERVPGATESFWQLAVDIGVISAPISVICNLIASWMYDAAKRVGSKKAAVPVPTQQSKVKLVVRVDDNATDILLDLGDVAAMAREVEMAIARVDQQH